MPLRAPVRLLVAEVAVQAAEVVVAPAWAQTTGALPRPALVVEVLAAAEPEGMPAERPWLPRAWASVLISQLCAQP